LADNITPALWAVVALIGGLGIYAAIRRRIKGI
jgi:hypothetical protein